MILQDLRKLAELLCLEGVGLLLSWVAGQLLLSWVLLVSTRYTAARETEGLQPVKSSKWWLRPS